MMVEGTVKVEGTVEVQGTVQVEGPVKVQGVANKESLLKRGGIALEDRKWDDAKSFFNEALNADAECAEAYLGMLLADVELPSADSISALDREKSIVALTDNENYKKYLRFADEVQLEKLDSSIRTAKDRIEHNKIETSALIEKLRVARERFLPARSLIVAAYGRTVALRADGTVLAAGDNEHGECDISGWRNIIAISAGFYHTVGLRSNGTVVATGDNRYGQCNVSDWNDIVAIAVGDWHTVGLRSDGSVVAVGKNENGECKVTGWGWEDKDTVAIWADSANTAGLKSDGTVVVVGNNDNHQCDQYWSDISSVTMKDGRLLGIRTDGTVIDGGRVEFLVGLKKLYFNPDDWHDVVAVSIGSHVVGLRSDGQVFSEPAWANSVQVDVHDWHDIIDVSAGQDLVIGLRSEGAVVAAGKGCEQFNAADWHDVVSISTYGTHTVGLRADGRVMSVGDNEHGQCNVADWKLFNSYETLEQERQQALESAEQERQAQIAGLKKEQTSLNAEHNNLKGLFNGKRRKEIEARFAEIDAELKKLNG